MAGERAPIATFGVVRTPLLPVDDWLAWSEGVAGIDAAVDDAEAARRLAADRALLSQRLALASDRAEVREAITVASPSLDVAIGAWRAGGRPLGAHKIERGLVRYFTRMCTRATPFGLFAGCSLATIGERTDLTLAPRSTYRRRVRPDARLVLGRTPAGDDDVLVGNGTLFRVADRWRYVRARRDVEPWSFELVTVEATAHVDFAIAAAGDGVTRAGLVEALATREEVERDEAAAFVDALVERQILETGAALGLYGDGGANPAGVEPPADGGGERSSVHVDLYKPGSMTIGRDLVDALAEAAALIAAICEPRVNVALARFKAAFDARWEGASVPLLHALDEECGVGFDASDAPGLDSALLDAIGISPPFERSERWQARHAYLLRRVHEVLRNDQRELVLGDDDVAALCHDDAPPLPGSFGVAARLVSASPPGSGDGEWRVVVSGVTGHSPLGYVARFADLDDALLSAARAHARREQELRDDVILADVVHVPDARIGNVVRRPRLRDAYIECLDRASSPDGARRIALADLLVSVERGRVVLRTSGGEELLPDTTTVYDTATRHSLGLYRFLCELATQGAIAAGRWDWGPLRAAPFLPRVVRGRAILAPARWSLDGRQLAMLAGDDVALMRAAAALRVTLGLPRRVLYEDFDRRLLVDFDNVMTVDSFAREVRGKPAATLVEICPDLDDDSVRGPEGRYRHELFVCFVTPQPARPTTRVPPLGPSVQPPSTEWSYVKLYAGPAALDDLLVGFVRQLVEEAKRTRVIDDWFFVRYADPDPHLRLRVRCGRPEARQGIIADLQALAAGALTRGEVWRVQFDSYVRERRRYGGEAGMALAESIFTADSDAALAVLAALRATRDTEVWRAALVGCNLLARDLGLSSSQAAALFRRLADAYRREFAVDDAARKRIRAVFRKQRAALEALLGGAGDEALHAAFTVRSSQINGAARALDILVERGELMTSRDDFVAAILHMHVNRLVRASARAHELAICEFLARIHEGVEARRRRSG